MRDHHRLGIWISNKAHDRLKADAKKGRYKSVAEYSSMLFRAVYAARVGVQSDTTLDDEIARSLILYGAGHKTKAIANNIGIPEARVKRFIDAWKSEVIAT